MMLHFLINKDIIDLLNDNDVVGSNITMIIHLIIIVMVLQQMLLHILVETFGGQNQNIFQHYHFSKVILLKEITQNIWYLKTIQDITLYIIQK